MTVLKCTNKNIIECKNAVNYTMSYCGKKLDSTIDLNNMPDSMKTHTECINNSLVAYFDDDSNKLYTCFSKTEYSKRLEKTMKEWAKK